MNAKIRRSIEESLYDDLTDGAAVTSSSVASGAESTFNSDSLKKIAEDIKAIKRPPFDFINPLGVYGMRVFEEPLPPQKMKLSAHVQISDEFRKKYNEWLLVEFGRGRPVLERSQYMVCENMNAIIAPHGGAALLSRVLT